MEYLEHQRRRPRRSRRWAVRMAPGPLENCADAPVVSDCDMEGGAGVRGRRRAGEWGACCGGSKEGRDKGHVFIHFASVGRYGCSFAISVLCAFRFGTDVPPVPNVVYSMCSRAGETETARCPLCTRGFPKHAAVHAALCDDASGNEQILFSSMAT
ncbi:hypothetical protein PHLGIDRAFT_290315 [Phlebiopsis gigantea 11061_1 CR5-6]|uniref:Uncharacterized protein n=1 Tax=Phlebiopsis gigantea (strain 11061_1 CR5-6) TaxID=745531 RepID=A0A0C3PBZ6_PHLG1|nr:hypothetical protein PHLGIDRAFT_290315 [Phlebiopsis gigantea 11061_1 CR5-6]